MLLMIVISFAGPKVNAKAFELDTNMFKLKLQTTVLLAILLLTIFALYAKFWLRKTIILLATHSGAFGFYIGVLKKDLLWSIQNQYRDSKKDSKNGKKKLSSKTRLLKNFSYKNRDKIMMKK